jgi:malonate-semialdehyde dehydrogenase (acetylating)/methylmalonate-semialdehyde dehydrogenase
VLPVGTAHDETRTQVAECGRQAALGDGLEPGTDLGPVVSATARTGVAAIESGVAEGAKTVLDGRNASVAERPRGYFRRPDLLDEVRPEMRVYQEEIFGPVVAMSGREPRPGDRADQRRRFRQRASIFTESGSAARKFRYEVETGNIGINVGVAAPVSNFPFSGAKRSFFGSLHPRAGTRSVLFTESKVVITRWTTGDRGPVSGVGR